MDTKKVQVLLDPVELTEIEGGGNLVLCRLEGIEIQVIISLEGHIFNWLR